MDQEENVGLDKGKKHGNATKNTIIGIAALVLWGFGAWYLYRHGPDAFSFFVSAADLHRSSLMYGGIAFVAMCVCAANFVVSLLLLGRGNVSFKSLFLSATATTVFGIFMLALGAFSFAMNFLTAPDDDIVKKTRGW